jgi:hypothetical protein
MGIELEYDGVGSIPEMTVKELFTEKDGKMVFTGIEGLKTQGDVDSLSEALRKERNDHGALKESFKAYDGLDALKARSAIEQNEILNLKLKDGIASEDVQSHIRTKIESGLKDFSTENQDLKQKLGILEGEKLTANHTKLIKELAQKDISEDMLDLVSGNLISISEVDMSGELVTTGIGGYEKGLTIKSVLSKMIEKNPRLMKQNSAGQGTGAQGGNSAVKNPFSKEHFNRTEQHKLMQENPSLAKSLEAQAKKE